MSLNVAIQAGAPFAPGASWVLSDACDTYPVTSAEIVTFVDVLGQVRDPELALHRARQALSSDGRVFIAETRSYAGQMLDAPQRRGFDDQGLRSILRRAGFAAPEWLCDGGTFTCLVASVDEREDSRALSNACWHAGLELGFGGGDGLSVSTQSALLQCARSDRAEVALEAHLTLARGFIAGRDGDSAAQHWLEARNVEPRDARSWSGLASLALAAGDTESAWELSLEAVQRAPSDPGANRVYAESALALGDPQAVEALVAACRLAPDDPLLATRVAAVAAEQGDYRTGILTFERLLRYGPIDNAAFEVTFAWLLILGHRVADAVSRARRAAILDPQSPCVAELWQALDQLCGASLPQA